jgi:hypothetical protein
VTVWGKGTFRRYRRNPDQVIANRGKSAVLRQEET